MTQHEQKPERRGETGMTQEQKPESADTITFVHIATEDEK